MSVSFQAHNIVFNCSSGGPVGSFSMYVALLPPLISTQDYLQGRPGSPGSVKLLSVKAELFSPHHYSLFPPLPL